MGKYMIQFSYTGEGVKGLLKEGGTKRREVVEQLVKGLGGKVEAMYWSFGEHDGIVIVDAPDNTRVAAASLAVSASGAARIQTTVLLTAEEVDQVAKITVNYRPPSG